MDLPDQMPVTFLTLGALLGLPAGWLLAQWMRARANRDPLRKHPRGMEEKDPYRLNPAILTRPEAACYQALSSVLPPDHVLFVKVRFADLLQVTYGAADRAVAHAKIGNKVLDFVVCDAALAPKAAISLVPATVSRAESQTAEFISRVCAKTGLPLIQLPIAAEYSADEIARVLHPQLEGARVAV
jgi:hypothetical protein